MEINKDMRIKWKNKVFPHGKDIHKMVCPCCGYELKQGMSREITGALVKGTAISDSGSKYETLGLGGIEMLYCQSSVCEYKSSISSFRRLNEWVAIMKFVRSMTDEEIDEFLDDFSFKEKIYIKGKWKKNDFEDAYKIMKECIK